MVKKSEISEIMRQMGRRRWKGTTKQQRSEAARKAGQGNRRRKKKDRTAAARAAAKSITPEAAKLRAEKAARTRKRNRKLKEQLNGAAE